MDNAEGGHDSRTTKVWRAWSHVAAAVGVAWVHLTGAADAQLPFPALIGRVVDEANVLSAATRSDLASVLAAHERETTNQVVVATVRSLRGVAIDQYALQLARTWRLGQAGRDNGVLLLVAPFNRQVRIEVGSGLEGSIPNHLALRIVENDIVPRFRANDLDAGVRSGVRAILAATAGTYDAVPDWVRPLPWPAARLFALWQRHAEILGVLFVLALVACTFVYDRVRRWHEGGERRPSAWRFRGRRRDTDWDEPDGGSGGFGGGGGSFRGGGASGRW